MANATDRAIGFFEREVFGLLTDLGVMQQRTDEFVDQKKLVTGFVAAWATAAENVERDIIRQIEAGTTQVTV